MRFLLILAVLAFSLASCGPSVPGSTEQDLKVYTGGVDSSYLKLYEYDVLEGELTSSRTVLSGITGVLSKSERGILVPSSGVVFEVSDSGTEIVLEGDDVFRLAVEVEGSIVALGDKGVHVGDEILDANARDLDPAEGGVYLLTDGGVRYLEFGESETVLLLEGNYNDLLYDSPYLYLLGSTSLDLYLVQGNIELELQNRWGLSGMFSRLRTGEGEDILVGGEDGLWILRYGDLHRVIDHPVDDFWIFEDLLFVVSEYTDSLEVWDVSDLSNPEKIDEIGALNLSNPSVLIEGE